MEEILKVIFDCGGVIYGEYVRDQIAGDDSDSIDVIIEKIDILVKLLTEYEYTPINETNHIFVSKHPDLLPLKVIIVEKKREYEYLIPPIELDFNVNSLAITGDELYNWACLSHCDDLFVPNVIECIKNRTMLKNKNINNDLSKLLDRGYKLIGEFDCQHEEYDTDDAYEDYLYRAAREPKSEWF